MKFVQNFTIGILGEPDSYKLWKELLSRRDVRRILNSNKCKNILIVAGGHGTELEVLIELYGRQILKKITFNDKFLCFTNDIKRKYPQVNIIEGDFLEANMGKLDGCVVLMNSPYLKRTWLKFVEKVVELKPSIIVTINPDPTNNKSDFGEKWRSICIKNGLIDRTDVTHYFPNVSSGRISAFTMDTREQANTDLFKSDDPLLDSILEKVTTDDPTSFVIRGAQAVSGYGDKNKHHSISEQKDSSHVYSSIMSCGKEGLSIKYSNKKIENKKHIDEMRGSFVITNRFFGKNNPDPAFLIEDMENYNLSYDCLGFKLNKDETVENFISVYSSTVYRYLMDKMRNGGFDITQGNFMRLVRLDLTKKWTEEEIHAELGITEEENDRIKQGN